MGITLPHSLAYGGNTTSATRDEFMVEQTGKRNIVKLLRIHFGISSGLFDLRSWMDSNAASTPGIYNVFVGRKGKLSGIIVNMYTNCFKSFVTLVNDSLNASARSSTPNITLSEIIVSGWGVRFDNPTNFLGCCRSYD